MSFAPVFSRLRPASLRPLPLLLLGVAACLPGLLRAQSPGSLDTSYTPDRNGGSSFAVVVQYDPLSKAETITIGGDATELTFTQADGTFVSGFEGVLLGGLSRTVYTIAPELLTITARGTHNLYIGGRFGKNVYQDPVGPAQNIARLNPQGVIDDAFQPGTGANDNVLAIVPLDDNGAGGLIIGGQFTSFNGQAFNRLVRLNEDGSINPAFNPVNVTDAVFAMTPQIDPTTGAANGQILVGGDFSTVNNDTYTKLFRMDELGNVDPTFRPAIDARVLAVAVQPDGKIVIGGQFAVVNGVAVGHLARLNVDGSLDTTFNANVSVLPANTSAPVAVYVVRLLADGRMYVGGQFYAVDGATRHYVGLINADGSLDTSFDPGDNIINSVQSIAVQADNRVLIGETVSKKDNNVFPPSAERLFGVAPLVEDSVSLAATQPSAREGTSATRQVGAFKITRLGDTTQPLAVYFTVTGDAQAGVTYKPLAATAVGGDVYKATVPAGVNSVKLKVKPLDGTMTRAHETVTLTLIAAPDNASRYTSDGSSATVSIHRAR